MTSAEGRALYEACRTSGAAQAEAYHNLGRYLYQVAFNLVRSRPQLHDLAEEATQEALITIWQSLDSLEDPDRFMAWCARVVINKVYDACRKLGVGLGSEQAPASEAAQLARRRRVPINRLDSLDLAAETGAPLPGVAESLPQASPDAQYAQRELLDVLAERIGAHPGLSRQAKTVLVRGFLNDWDDNTLATYLKTTRSNVHTIRSRALTHLREDEEFCRLLQEYMKE